MYQQPDGMHQSNWYYFHNKEHDNQITRIFGSALNELNNSQIVHAIQFRAQAAVIRAMLLFA